MYTPLCSPKKLSPLLRHAEIWCKSNISSRHYVVSTGPQDSVGRLFCLRLWQFSASVWCPPLGLLSSRQQLLLGTAEAQEWDGSAWICSALDGSISSLAGSCSYWGERVELSSGNLLSPWCRQGAGTAPTEDLWSKGLEQSSWNLLSPQGEARFLFSDQATIV